MGQISVSLPADGSTADVADYNSPINTIVNEFNSNIDNSNIKAGAAIDGSKLADSSITPAKIDYTTAVRPVVMTYTMPASSNASLAITGVGFRPRMVMTHWRGGSASSATGLTGSASVAIGGSGVTQSLSAWNATSGSFFTSGSTTSFVGVAASGGSAFDWSASLTSFDSDGITMNYTYTTGSTTSRSVTFIFF